MPLSKGPLHCRTRCRVFVTRNAYASGSIVLDERPRRPALGQLRDPCQRNRITQRLSVEVELDGAVRSCHSVDEFDLMPSAVLVRNPCGRRRDRHSVRRVRAMNPQDPVILQTRSVRVPSRRVKAKSCPGCESIHRPKKSTARRGVNIIPAVVAACVVEHGVRQVARLSADETSIRVDIFARAIAGICRGDVVSEIAFWNPSAANDGT